MNTAPLWILSILLLLTSLLCISGGCVSHAEKFEQEGESGESAEEEAEEHQPYGGEAVDEGYANEEAMDPEPEATYQEQEPEEMPERVDGPLHNHPGTSVEPFMGEGYSAYPFP